MQDHDGPADAGESTQPKKRGRKAKVSEAGVDPSAQKAAEEIESVSYGDVTLTAEEVATIRATAEREVDAELRAKAKKELLSTLKEGARQRRGLGTADPMVDVTLDLAPFCQVRGIGQIVINGFPYYHGRTYNVPLSLARTLVEIQARGWDHQSEVDGKSRTFYRKRDAVLSAKGSGNTGLRV